MFKTFVQIVFKTYVFLCLPENKWKILSTGVMWGALKKGSRSQICSFLRHSSFYNFTFMETISNHTDSCPKDRMWSPKAYNPRGRPIYCYCSQAESQSNLHLCDSMVTASIGKAISAATVRRRLHMNGLYARVPRVCIPLSVQSRGSRLK
ncbi:HTH_Tnp_Tc3_2 domain-containing protein [Trichonephila clavipes]|nr:HTH_Tnp_Tc3_2 domain-containing protein [Trichonephila clavipes]